MSTQPLPLDFHHLGVHPDTVIRANERGVAPDVIHELRKSYKMLPLRIMTGVAATLAELMRERFHVHMARIIVTVVDVDGVYVA